MPSPLTPYLATCTALSDQLSADLDAALAQRNTARAERDAARTSVRTLTQRLAAYDMVPEVQAEIRARTLTTAQAAVLRQQQALAAAGGVGPGPGGWLT